MAVRFYDDAIMNKIKHWVKDPNMRILKPDETTRLFEIEADTNKDEPLTLPLIAISRDKNIEILETTKQSKSFRGFIQKQTKEQNVPLNVIPIRIGYQIDIYTKDMEDADEYVRNFVFNLINFPKLIVELPYNNLKLEHVANLYLDPSIIDNSDIKEHLFEHEFVRFTLKFTIDDAYLFSLPTKQNARIESIELDVTDRTLNEVVEESEEQIIYNETTKKSKK